MADTSIALTTLTPQQAATNAAMEKSGNFTFADGTTASAGANPYTSTGTPAPLITTSSASRTNYADNVTALNTATSNLTGSNPSVVDYLNKSGMPSDYNSRAAMAKQYGIEGYTGSAAQNTQLLGILQNGGKTDTTSKTDTTTPAKTDTTGGGATSTTEDPAVTKIKNDLSAQYADSLTALDNQVNNAKNTLSQAAAMVQNDPAEVAAINLITQKFDTQIQAMKDKNAVLLGSQMTNAARSGAMQYANEMTSNFMSEEQDKATQRVADLITQEMSAILKAKQAYEKGDISAFNAASKALDAANKSKTDAINKLLDETDKAVKTYQAQQKIDAAAVKQQTTDNIRISTANASAIAKNIADSGITDPTKRKQYIEAMAQKLGITDPSYLESAVAKVELSNANTQSTINKRNQPPKPATVKPTGKNTYKTFNNKPTSADISKVNAYIQSIGGNQDAIDAANADETTFYKVLNAIPKKTTTTPVTPP
jgi:hypothetical protein